MEFRQLRALVEDIASHESESLRESASRDLLRKVTLQEISWEQHDELMRVLYPQRYVNFTQDCPSLDDFGDEAVDGRRNEKNSQTGKE